MPSFNFNWSDVSLLQSIIVYLATTLGDIVWVFYIRRTGSGKATQAALFAGLIMLLSAVAVTSYVKNNSYLIPAVLGALTGTFITVKFDSKEKK